MTFEEHWAKTWKPSGQPAGLDAAFREVAIKAWNACVDSVAGSLEKSDSAIRLMAGEMTAGELRTTKAVMNGCKAGVLGLRQPD